MKCKNCNTEINSKFCPECGQPARLKRINGKYIIHEIGNVLYFERGLLYTIRKLITSPGQAVRNYLTENRSRLVKPIIFIILTSLIYTLTISIFHIEDGYFTYEGDEPSSAQSKITTWIQSHYGYANLIMGIFIAFWVKLFFKKYRFNIFEILIMLCFVMGIEMLIFSIFGLVHGVTNLNIMSIGGMVGMGYCSWAIGNFFGKTQIINYVKAIIAFILGMVTLILLATIVGVLIDIIKGY